MDFYNGVDFYSYPYGGMLLDTDCETELSPAAAATAPAVWLVVVKGLEGHYLSQIVCAVRTKAAALARVQTHEAANGDDVGKTFVTGYRVETGAAPAVYIAMVSGPIGHGITAVSEVKATAQVSASSLMLQAIMFGVGDECDCTVQRFGVSDA